MTVKLREFFYSHEKYDIDYMEQVSDGTFEKGCCNMGYGALYQLHQASLQFAESVMEDGGKIINIQVVEEPTRDHCGNKRIYVWYVCDG